ncbi:hypothetical protein TcasGA2_TC011531 [Tribolium castaneum]|uniref:Uncharacterized protein n=1 Tax=Tribolium castaneum TaxID=7070 RepID=D6W6B1_TRICA|nr:hypothetical protein TcasGA2_TC011531 [Tribolium castaneum]
MRSVSAQHPRGPRATGPHHCERLPLFGVRISHLDHNSDADLVHRLRRDAVMVTGTASPGTRQSVQVARGDQCSRDATAPWSTQATGPSRTRGC